MLAPVILPSLIELDMGAFEGKTYDQLKDDPAYRRWIDTRGMSAPPGGESGDEFAARLRGALGHIAEDARRCGIRRAASTTGGCCWTFSGRSWPPDCPPPPDGSGSALPVWPPGWTP